MDVPKIYGEERKELLHIRALPIPGGEPVNGKGVPKIVYPWLVAPTIGSADADLIAQYPVVVAERICLQPPAASHRKERSPFSGC